MFRKWKEARQRAQQLRETIAKLQDIPPVQDTVLVAMIMGVFDSPSSIDQAKNDLAGSFIDVSNHGFAHHGRKQFGLTEMPSATLALRTPTSTFCMLEFIFHDGQLAMCGIDIKHTDTSFINASMTIENALQEECAARGFAVPTWHGDVIAFYRSDVEGLWISNLNDNGNTIRLVERAFGSQFLT